MPRRAVATPLQDGRVRTLPPIGPGRAQTDRRLSVIVATVVALGVLTASFAAIDLISGGQRIGLLRFVTLVVVVAVGDISLLRIRIGSNGNSFTWGEASLILAVVLTGWPWFILVGSLTVLGRQLLSGRPLLKASYNAATVSIGGLWGCLAYRAATGSWHVPDFIDVRVAVGLFAAATAYFVWTSVSIILVVSTAQGLPFLPVLRRGFALRMLMFVGNTAVGIALAWIGSRSLGTVIALPFFFALLYGVYNSYLRAQQERDTWRELLGASHDLSRVDEHDVGSIVVSRTSSLFAAEFVELLIIDDEGQEEVRRHPPGLQDVRPHGLTSLLDLVANAGDPVQVRVRSGAASVPREVREQLEDLGLAAAVAVRLDLGPVSRGMLCIGFRSPEQMRHRELQVLATFANNVSVAERNAHMFAQSNAQRARLSSIIDSTSDGILLVDAEGIVRSWNPAMERITGTASVDAEGSELSATLRATVADGTEVAIPMLFAQLRRTDHMSMEATVSTSAGTTREVLLSASAIRDGDGLDAAVVVTRDVTAQREAEQAKQDFVATVSHELRTPLTPILGFLRLFQRPDYRPSEEVRRGILDQMLTQARALERLVEDLLSVSSLERGQFSITMAEAACDDVVDRAVADFSATSRRVVQVEPCPAAVARCDPDRLRQVLANLLSNAEKYSPAGSPIEVAVTRRSDQPGPSSRGGPHVGMVDSGHDEVWLSVRDYGFGIPDDRRDEIFEPFRRLGNPLTRETRGTGLGLHIARSLVTGMGGRIWADRAPGGGSVFTVALDTVATQLPADPRSVSGRAGAAGPAAGEPAIPPGDVAEPVRELDSRGRGLTPAAPAAAGSARAGVAERAGVRG